jgi:hypothetical protein
MLTETPTHRTEPERYLMVFAKLLLPARATPYRPGATPNWWASRA